MSPSPPPPPTPADDRCGPRPGRRSSVLEAGGAFVLLVSVIAAAAFWMMWEDVQEEPAGDLAFGLAALFATGWALVLVGPGIVIMAMAAQRRRYLAVGLALAGVLCDFVIIGAFAMGLVAVLP